MQPIRFSLNGRHRDAMVRPDQSLLQLLRDDCGLSGTKEGCSTGYCGACTVLVDGDPVNACLFFAVDADRRHVTTVEGLGACDGALHPVQQAFVDAGALQCGFCTPGMVVSAAALLRERADPSESEIRAALAGNLCRCTGYQSIVTAVRNAARALREAGATAPKDSDRVRSRA